MIAVSGTTLAIIAGIATVTAAAAQVAQAQQAAATGRSKARLFARDAQRRRDIAQQQAEESRRDTSRLLGTQRALTAGSGIDFAGTPVLVGGDTAAEGELQAQRILVTGLSEAAGLDAAAAFAKRGGEDAQAAGFIGAGVTLLTGFSRINFGQSSGARIPRLPVGSRFNKGEA